MPRLCILSDIFCAYRHPVCARSNYRTIFAEIGSIHSEMVHIVRHILRIQAACMREITQSDKSRAYCPIYFAHTGCLYARNHTVRHISRILSDIFCAYRQPVSAKSDCPTNLAHIVRHILRIHAACIRKLDCPTYLAHIVRYILRIQAACMREITPSDIFCGYRQHSCQYCAYCPTYFAHAGCLYARYILDNMRNICWTA